MSYYYTKIKREKSKCQYKKKIIIKINNILSQHIHKQIKSIARLNEDKWLIRTFLKFLL